MVDETVTHDAHADDNPDGLPPRPEMDDSPPIIDAHRTFLATLVAATLFIAAVVSFIL